MFSYCVRVLHYSEDAAYKRLQAARVARLFPVIFSMLADGRLHLSAVVMLAAHLKPDNVDKLLTAAAHQTKSGIEKLIAAHFPRPDLPTMVQPVTPAFTGGIVAPGQVAALAPVADTLALVAPAAIEAPAPRPKITPLSPGRIAWQLTVDQEAQVRRGLQTAKPRAHAQGPRHS